MTPGRRPVGGCADETAPAEPAPVDCVGAVPATGVSLAPVANGGETGGAEGGEIGAGGGETVVGDDGVAGTVCTAWHLGH